MLQVAAAAAARLPPKSTASRVQRVRGPAQRSLMEDLPEFNPLPIPAIYIPEFGKESTFVNMDGTFKMPDIPDIQTITPPDMHSVERRLAAPQLSALGLDSIPYQAPIVNSDNTNTQKGSIQQQSTGLTADAQQPYSNQQDQKQWQQDQQQLRKLAQVPMRRGARC